MISVISQYYQQAMWNRHRNIAHDAGRRVKEEKFENREISRVGPSSTFGHGTIDDIFGTASKYIVRPSPLISFIRIKCWNFITIQYSLSYIMYTRV